MPQQEALLSALPKRTVTAYERDGEKLYTYGDKDTRTLYIGDAPAYRQDPVPGPGPAGLPGKDRRRRIVQLLGLHG